MSEEQERRGREGGRWLNERPTSEEFAAWFKESMKIDDQLSIEDYIGGVVLIPAVDTKAKYVKEFRDGKPVIESREELSFIPYAKVETRIAYFWDLLEARRAELVGVVERITPQRLDVELQAVKTSTAEDGAMVVEYGRPSALATMAHQLPEGFSVTSVPVGDGFSHFVCCTVRVAIYDRAQYEDKGSSNAVPIRVGQGTKQVPLAKSYNNRSWADDSSLMKAETGALGRALGFAGIFVIPGSGVATAEDMAEQAAQGDAAVATGQPESNEGPAAPAEQPARTGSEQAEDDGQALRSRAAELWRELSENYPKVAQEDFGPWARERNLRGLGEARGAMLRGVVKKLEKLLDEAKQATEEREGGRDVSSEETQAPAGAGEEAAGDGDEPGGSAG